LRRRGLTPRRVLAPEEPDGQHAEGERAAREDHRLPTGKLLEIADELTRLAMTQIPTEALDLLGATVGVRRQHRLRAFFSQMLAGLAKRLGYARPMSTRDVTCSVACSIIGVLCPPWLPCGV
jgi:hypothetical protein